MVLSSVTEEHTREEWLLRSWWWVVVVCHSQVGFCQTVSVSLDSRPDLECSKSGWEVPHVPQSSRPQRPPRPRPRSCPIGRTNPPSGGAPASTWTRSSRVPSSSRFSSDTLGGEKGVAMNNPFDPGYYNEEELAGFGFKSVGTNVRIAKNSTIIGLSNISLGSNVRIDGYCGIVAAGVGSVSIGSFIHIGGWCYLSAGDGIVMEDFSGLSQGVRIYSRTEDFSGEHLTNPTVPEKFTGVKHGAVTLKRHVVIGSGTVILPGVTIGEGSSVGALSLVTKSLDPWGVFCGCPAKRLKDRSKRLLKLESELMKELAQQGASLDKDFPALDRDQ